MAKYRNLLPFFGGDKITSISARSLLSRVSIKLPSVFQISKSPPKSFPNILAGGPSIVIIDFPSSL